MRRSLYILSFAIATLCLTSCGVDKYLRPGEKVLHRNEVNVRMADSGSVPKEVSDALSNTQQYYHQLPNKRFLFMRLKMRLYCSTNPDDSSRWSQFWRNLGEPPVVYDAHSAQSTALQLKTLLKTKGCFNSTVTTDTLHYGQNSVIARYNITATQRRKIAELSFSCRQQKEIEELLQSEKWVEASLLKVGDYYDQQVMTQEQARIASSLKDSGYYYASADMVRFLVDTTYDSQLLSIIVSIRLPQRIVNDSVVLQPLQKYKLDNIYLYPNISTSLKAAELHPDTLIYPHQSYSGRITDYRFIYKDVITPSPRVICRSLLLRSGQTYRPRFGQLTSNALFGLHNFKYVDISYEESPNSTDSNRLLDTKIRLLNNTRHKLTLSLELTNTSDFGNAESNFLTSGNVGLGTTLGYQNNNLFGGAELLNVEGSLLFDLPKNVFSGSGKDFYNTFASFENNLNITLDLPSFLMPFANRLPWQYNRPHTLIGANASYLYRNISMPDTDFALERTLIGGSFGYTWSHRRFHQHKLLPINFTYSHIVNGSEYYDWLYLTSLDLMKVIFLTHDYILLNTHYEYTYSNQLIGTRNNFSYLNFSVETAGNLLNAIDRLFTSKNKNDSLYYQYFRLEGEYKRYIYWGDKNTLVLRALVGFGIPYGNSIAIPYEKMFIGGGPTTLRGWGLRHLGGYGTNYDHDAAKQLTLGMGEIMLVGNIEHRFPIIGIFEGALFADLGNVWTYYDWGFQDDRLLYSPMELLKTVALDVGFGLRANISIITLRLDLAVPIHDPTYAEGERWIHSHLGWDKLVFNFGINYPF
ncbi:MAG: BamA/TamA family outer membrane protein [Bacteroidales bacterium]|nr:BamA/TamA family outer membrane protein [Bacteroidales bacterium]